jgi:hypothetical protein
LNQSKEDPALTDPMQEQKSKFESCSEIEWLTILKNRLEDLLKEGMNTKDQSRANELGLLRKLENDIMERYDIISEKVAKTEKLQPDNSYISKAKTHTDNDRDKTLKAEIDRLNTLLTKTTNENKRLNEENFKLKTKLTVDAKTLAH